MMNKLRSLTYRSLTEYDSNGSLRLPCKNKEKTDIMPDLKPIKKPKRM